MGIKGDVHRARVVILVKNLGPGPAAVGAAKDSAFIIGSERVADGGDHDDVRIGGIDDDRPDLARVLEANIGPGLAPVCRAIDPIAPSDIAAQGPLARAHIDNVGSAGGHGYGPDRGIGLSVEQGLPRAPGVGGLPDPARRSAKEKDVRTPGNPCHGQGAAAAIGAYASPRQSVER